MGLKSFLKRLFSPPKAQGKRRDDIIDGRYIQVVTAQGPALPVENSSPSMPTTSRQAIIPPTRRTDKSLNLDAAQFAPISSSAATAAARASSTVSNNPWWGRLDTIPPATDERTLLIDRTLVAFGLLAPDDLVEIHKIGDRMLEISGDRGLADIAARAAVAASEAERQQIKEQKKAEAAERKRRNAEAVARRKATDIIFLGRGVSRGLADRRANIEKLQAAGLPVLASPADIASALNIAVPRLRWLAFHSEAAELIHYVRFTVPKKSGGVRELSAPHRDLAIAQRWILQNILQKLPTHDAAHGFIKRRSIRTNAVPHVGQQFLVNLDLENFFPTITFPRIRGALEHIGYSPAAATVLALLTTESPRREVEYAGRRFFVAVGPRALPQGACTSPAFSNLIARRLDSRLAGTAEKLGWRYTRYADDLSFSAKAAIEPKSQVGYLLARIRHIVQNEGFTVNEKKTRVLKCSTTMNVTGVVVNDKLNVRRREVRRLRAILHNAARHGLASQNRDAHPNFASKLRGQIAFLEMINPELGHKLADEFRSIRD